MCVCWPVNRRCVLAIKYMCLVDHTYAETAKTKTRKRKVRRNGAELSGGQGEFPNKLRPEVGLLSQTVAFCPATGRFKIRMNSAYFVNIFQYFHPLYCTRDYTRFARKNRNNREKGTSPGFGAHPTCSLKTLWAGYHDPHPTTQGRCVCSFPLDPDLSLHRQRAQGGHLRPVVGLRVLLPYSSEISALDVTRNPIFAQKTLARGFFGQFWL